MYGASASERTAIVKAAKSKIGSWYQWAASGPRTFDCSGLVYWAYNQAGVNIPRYASYGWAANSQHITASQVRPGDVLYFRNRNNGTTIGHIGIDIGGGMMVEAPGAGKQVRISNWSARKDFTYAGRI